MTARTVVIVSAGVSQPSSTRLLADQLASATIAALNERAEHAAVEVIELRELAHDVTNAALTGFASERLGKVLSRVREADALIAVSPIFNASYSGLFKSFFDVLEEDSLRGKPTLIAAAGGTERHSLALEHGLRPLFAHLRALVMPTAVYAAASDWGATGNRGRDSALSARIRRAAGELAELIGQLPTQDALDGFKDVVPFDQLLLAD